MKKFLAVFLLTAIAGWSLDGNQILHTRSRNKPYELIQESTQFVETVLKNAKALESDAEILKFASDQVTVDGIFVELGTGMGRTTNFLAALNPRQIIYTFDSYLGHPADWDKGDNRFMAKDFFAWPEGKELPNFLNNVELTKGWFVDTLPGFVENTDGTIAFLHVDCEIYESTIQGLDLLGSKITEGTIILFDELYNYANYKNHEYRALQEFLEKNSLEAEYLAYNRFHEQVVVCIHLKK